jgi:hypothetical protein
VDFRHWTSASNLSTSVLKLDTVWMKGATSYKLKPSPAPLGVGRSTSESPDSTIISSSPVLDSWVCCLQQHSRYHRSPSPVRNGTPLRGRRSHEPRGPSLAGALNWLHIDLEHRTHSIVRRGVGCWVIGRHADEGQWMRGLGLYEILLNPLGLDHTKKEMPGSRISMETEP